MSYLVKSFRTVHKLETIFTNKASNGVGSNIDISRYAHIGICVVTSAFQGTLKFQGSFLKYNDSNLDFSLTPSITNQWGYCAIRNHEDATFITGNTGISFTADTGVYLYELNTWTLRTMNAEVSNYVDGTINVYIYMVNNQ